MDFRKQRFGANEAIFREVNERIKSLASLFHWGKPDPLDLVCECRDSTCVQRIEMTQAEYAAIREEETHFAVYPGHADPDIERVISSHSRYEVVEKEGPAAEVAQGLSPRS